MLKLSLNSINKLYVVCSDILMVADSIYLWRFYNKQTKQEWLIELDNESIANQRFDLFSLNLPDELNLGEGVYMWEVYQSETEGSTNYKDMPMLSNGMAKVLTIFEENTTYEPSGTDTVYNG